MSEQYSREEFERDSKGETGDRLAERTKAMSDHPETIRPADRYFEACHAESALDDALLRALGADPENTETWPAGDFGYDWYDSSFELWGTRDDFLPTHDQLDAVWALGLQRGWICYQNGTERYVTGHLIGEPRPTRHGITEDKRTERMLRRQLQDQATALATVQREREEERERTAHCEQAMVECAQSWESRTKAAEAAKDAAEARCAALAQALRTFGSHRLPCAALAWTRGEGTGHPCNCGLNAALAPASTTDPEEE